MITPSAAQVRTLAPDASAARAGGRPADTILVLKAAEQRIALERPKDVRRVD